MYRQIITALVLSIFSIAPCSAAAHHAPAPRHRPDNPTARMLFQDMYTKAASALATKDLDGALAYHDPSFVQIPPSGAEVNLGEIRFWLSGWLDIAKSVHSDSSVMSANVQGTNGTVMVKSNITMLLVNPTTRAQASVIDQVVSKDTWTHDAGEWTLQRSKIISEATTANGHKVFDKDHPFAPPPAKVDSDNPEGVTGPPDIVLPSNNPNQGQGGYGNGGGGGGGGGRGGGGGGPNSR